MSTIFFVALSLVFSIEVWAVPFRPIKANSNNAKEVTYCTTASGTELKLDLYISTSVSGPRPLVVLVHGGGWVSGDKTDSSILRPKDDLLNRGISVASVNYRLATEVDWKEMVQDLKCATRFLRKYASFYNLNPDKFGVLGSSAGGHLANWVGTDNGIENGGDYLESFSDQSSVFQALVDWYGPTDLTYTFSGYTTNTQLQLFSTKTPEQAELEAASPVYKVTSSAPPVLIMHGKLDEIVIPEQAQALYEAYQAAGAEAQLYLLENLNHGFTPVDRSIEYTGMDEIIDITGDFLASKLGV